MKKKIFVLIILFLTSSTFAQVLKYKTKQFAHRNLINNEWSEWSEWEDVKIMLTLDGEKERFTIYSNEIQIYDVAKVEEQTIDKDGNEIYNFFCLTEDGSKCRIKHLFPKSPEHNMQLYIQFKDSEIVYNIYKFE